MIPTYYEIAQDRSTKENWTQQYFNYQPEFAPEVHDTMMRSLALSLNLEIPVGKFIEKELHSGVNVDPLAKQIMIENVRDEGKHYAQFKILCDMLNVPQEYIDEANKLSHVAMELADKHEYANMSFRIEVGLFLTLLAINRAFSTPGDGVSKSTIWVNGDERLHVLTGMRYTDDKGYTGSTDIKNFLFDALDWVTVGLPTTPVNYPDPEIYHREFWFKGASDLYHTYETDLYKRFNVVDIDLPYEYLKNEDGGYDPKFDDVDGSSYAYLLSPDGDLD